jgi:hypothetical protein
MAGLDVPQLSSRPGAAATLYLDFDGHFQASWGSFSNITSPVYTRDSADPAAFTATDLSAIQEIWTRVAEDFAPFNINVTTVVPASFDDATTHRVVIGGGWADWYGTQTNAVSFIGSFTNANPNVSYVFSNNIGTGFPRWVADQVSHEAGHSFGLVHQSTWSGSTLTAELSSGTNGWVPIMGSSLFASRSTWFNGTTNVSPTTFQDDMAIIGGAANGFGFVADEYADTLATAGLLPHTGGSVSLSGLIGQTGDQDVFKFTTAGGDLSFNLVGAAFGTNLDSVLELRDANGAVVTIANNTASGVYSSALATNVAAGTYYLIVRASGGYGNVGQYTLTGAIVPGVVTAPEVSVVINGTNLTSGGNVNFGSTYVGTPVVLTFTVQNLGNCELLLSQLDGGAFPAGCSLLANLAATTLAAGQSTTFSVQLDALLAGSFDGAIHLLSDDADESCFDIALSGTVAEPPTPEITVYDGPIELTLGDSVPFGTTLLGNAVTRTFTIQNVGNADLVLQQVVDSDLPAGFSLVQGLGATTLAPTDFTTFVVRFDALASGLFSGSFFLLSDDEDEGSFEIFVSGFVAAPEIRIFDASAEYASGDGFDFGSTPAGTSLSHTFTIQNTGDHALDVSGVDGDALPVGFSLITGFGNTTVAPGASIILTVQFDAVVAGTFGGTLRVLSSDSDESSFDIVLSGVATAPEISVSVGGTDVAGGGAIDFGVTEVGTPVTRTVTVTNVGNGDLVLSPIDPSALPAGFSLVSDLGSTTLAAGQSTTFTLRLNATAAGSSGGVIHVLSNDADEGSFGLALQGVVETPPPPPPTLPAVQIIDNGADGFCATGPWHVKSKGGYEQDLHVAHKAPDPPKKPHKNDKQAEKFNKKFATATWTFTGLTAGQYRVSVTVPGHSGFATNAPFSVFDGSNLLKTVAVNQSKLKGDAKRDQFHWRELGAFTIEGGTLVVQLTNRANGKVAADAVKIERVTTPTSLGNPQSSTSTPAPSQHDSIWLDLLAADIAEQASKPRT